MPAHTSGDHRVQPPPSRATRSGLLRTVPGWILSLSKGADHTASPGNLGQHLTTKNRVFVCLTRIPPISVCLFSSFPGFEEKVVVMESRGIPKSLSQNPARLGDQAVRGTWQGITPLPLLPARSFTPKSGVRPGGCTGREGQRAKGGLAVGLAGGQRCPGAGWECSPCKKRGSGWLAQDEKPLLPHWPVLPGALRALCRAPAVVGGVGSSSQHRGLDVLGAEGLWALRCQTPTRPAPHGSPSLRPQGRAPGVHGGSRTRPGAPCEARRQPRREAPLREGPVLQSFPKARCRSPVQTSWFIRHIACPR